MADHKRKKKKRGRSKLFTSCFRSFPTADERPILNDKSDRRSTINGRLGKPVVLIAASGGVKDDVISDVKSADADVSGTGTGTGGDCDTERSSYGRSVYRLLKSVLFDSVMVKKICSSSKSSTASDTALSSTEKTGKQSDDCNPCDMESTDIEDSSTRSNLLSSSSRATSSSYTSSSSSSINSNSRWLSEPKTSSSPADTTDSNHQISSTSSSLHKPNLITSTLQTDSIWLPLAKSSSLLRSSSDHKLDSIDSTNVISSNPDKTKFSSNNSWNIRWSLFLVLSLIVLVVYGRIYAILCTSIWFYLVPCRGRVKRVNSVSNSGVDTESEQYKKRVIMAGLLDRTRNPLR